MSSIVTLADLDWECTQYLQSFELPTLNSLQPKKPNGHNVLPVDPNEVDLEEPRSDIPGDTESETDNTIINFEDYGVGMLLHHPVVWSYFGGYVSFENRADWSSNETVLQMLIEFLSEQKWQQNTNKFSTFSVDEFVEYLCAELSISHPAEAGILIRGNLHAERIALEHVVKNRYTLYVETTKRELEHFNQQMQTFQGNGRKLAKKRRKRTTEDPEETIEISEVEAADEDKDNVDQDQLQREVVENKDEHVEESGALVYAQVSEPVVPVTSNNPSAPVTTVTAAPASGQSKRKMTPTFNPPYETSMNVYLPSGLPSITSNGAFKAGISHCGDADLGVLELHAIENRLVGGQPGEFDPSGEIGARIGQGRDESPGVGKQAAGVPLHHHPRGAVTAAPDDRPVAQQVAGLHAVGELRPILDRSDHRRRQPRQQQPGADRLHDTTAPEVEIAHGVLPEKGKTKAWPYDPGMTQIFPALQIPVGASLLAMAVTHSTCMSTDTLQSRAGSLLQRGYVRR